MILDRISVKRHNAVRSNDPNSNTLTELLTLFTYRTIDPFQIPFMVVALISCYGAKLTAVRVGFLLCWSLQISMGAYLISVAGLGTQLSIFYHLHNLEMVYAIMLIMGFTGLFVDSVLKYVGNKTKER